MTMRTTRDRTNHPYYPDCRNQYLRDKALRRYHSMPKDERKVISFTSSLITQTAQEASLRKAVNHRAPWTEFEDVYLEANLHPTPRELAAELNRTCYGVEARMKRIRRERRKS